MKQNQKNSIDGNRKVSMNLEQYVARNGDGPFLLLMEGDPRWYTAFIKDGTVRCDDIHTGSAVDLAGADIDSVSIRGNGFALFNCHPEQYRKGSIALSKLTGRSDLMLWHDGFDRDGKLARHSLVPVKLKESSLPGVYDAVKEDGSIIPVCPCFDRYRAENGCGDYLFWRLNHGDETSDAFSLYILDKKYNSTAAGYSGGVSLVKRKGKAAF